MIARARGVTLVELLVALAILGIMAGFVGAVWPQRERRDAASDATELATIRAARLQALNSGMPVTVVVALGERETLVTALPEGRLIGAESFGLDALSGTRGVDP